LGTELNLKRKGETQKEISKYHKISRVPIKSPLGDLGADANTEDVRMYDMRQAAWSGLTQLNFQLDSFHN